MDKILVVIDMQTNFIKECNAENIVNSVVNKIKSKQEEGYDVLLTLDKSGGNLDYRIREACVNPKIYEKHTYGCEKLIIDLKNRNPASVEFIGICTDICVMANVIGTMIFLPFTKLIVDSSCCASKGSGHEAALQIMKSCNITVI